MLNERGRPLLYLPRPARKRLCPPIAFRAQRSGARARARKSKCSKSRWIDGSIASTSTKIRIGRQSPRKTNRGLACALLIALHCATAAHAQTTAFTYQGRLTDGGNPANGPYDLQLVLFDAATGGAQVGATLTRDDVPVANGLFTVSLDFGTAFAGAKRWLELRVRPGSSTGAYTNTPYS